jgi:hypothetical protein
MRQAEIPLRIARSVIAVRDGSAVRQGWTWSDERPVIAQSGAEYHVEIDARAEPQLGCAARRGDTLLVIQMDEVVADVGELLRGEAELRRLDILALGGLNGDVAVDGKNPRSVIGTEFDTTDLAEAIVEGREDDRRAACRTIFARRTDEESSFFLLGPEANFVEQPG